MDASTKIGWGILGAADIARKIVAALNDVAEAEVVAVASRTLEKAKAFASEVGIKKAYGSYQELLDDEEVTVVYIPLPSALHHEWVIKAAQKGKNILCEKPFAAHPGEAKEIIDACEKNNVQLMVGEMWHHHPRTQKIAEHLATLGEVHDVHAKFTTSFGDPKNFEDIRYNKELEPFGALGDLGWYTISAILFAHREMPVKVWATQSYHKDNPAQVPIKTSAFLWFKDGKTASFQCHFTDVLVQTFHIYTSKGTIVNPDFCIPFGASPKYAPTSEPDLKAKYQFISPKGEVEEYTLPDAKHEVCMVRKMTSLAKDKVREAWRATIPLAVQVVMEACFESSKRGDTVPIPEEFAELKPWVVAAKLPE